MICTDLKDFSPRRLNNKVFAYLKKSSNVRFT